MTASAKFPDQGVFVGAASSEEQANTGPAQSSQITQDSEFPNHELGGPTTPAPKNPGNEEPAFALEPDLPTDGRDEVGEEMIRELPQRPELSEPPSQPGASSQNP